MKNCNGCKTEKSLEFFWKHKTRKDGLCFYCKDCMRIRQQDFKKKNRQSCSRKQMEWYYENREKIREKINSAYVPHYTRKRRPMEEDKEYHAQWKRNNRDKVCVYEAKRRSVKLNAIPENVDHEAIAKIYKEAKIRREAGEDVHVDHIIPLQGKTVRGLHCASNLRIIPAIENLRKGNRLLTELITN